MKAKRSLIFTKLILLILIVYALGSLVSVRSRISQAQARTSLLEEEIAATDQANSRLAESIDEVGSSEGLEQAAREQLGFVYSGEIVFHDIGN